MKKDKEWLKDEILTDMRYLEGNREIQQLDIKYQTLREVVQKINSLDEPEVLSQEWVDRNKEPFHHFENNKVDYYVSADFLQNLLVPKPEKVVVPEIVAEYIQECHELGVDLGTAMTIETEFLKHIRDYIKNNEETFARAWLDGFTIANEDEELWEPIENYEGLKEPSKIKPDYYRVGEEDLIGLWSKIFTPEQFRAIMKSHIQKYVHRYDQKNGKEDLEKANYYIN